MTLWQCFYPGEEWVCYVIAETRAKAKYQFVSHFKESTWDALINVQAHKVKDTPDHQPGVYDTDCDVLEALGVQYETDTDV